MLTSVIMFFFFFFNDTATTEIYTLSLHDALPIRRRVRRYPQQTRRRPACCLKRRRLDRKIGRAHAELQSPCNLVCRLLLEKKKKKTETTQMEKKRKTSTINT